VPGILLGFDNKEVIISLLMVIKDNPINKYINQYVSATCDLRPTVAAPRL